MLSEALIKDTAAEGADPLPLLAFTLERLYRRYGRTLHKMEPAHYEALGGITGSINEAIMEAFSSPDRNPSIPADRKERERLLEAAFIPALVDINQTNGDPVSRIAVEQEIPAECRNLVTRLVNARLLVSDEGPADADGTRPTTYRVAHEALLRRWDWLKGVLDRQAGQLSTAQLVERQAAAWDKAKRASEWLDLRGVRLQEAVNVAGRDGFKKRLEGVPAAYIAACHRLDHAPMFKHRSALNGSFVAAVVGWLLVFFFASTPIPYASYLATKLYELQQQLHQLSFKSLEVIALAAIIGSASLVVYVAVFGIVSLYFWVSNNITYWKNRP